jgi:TFIIH basal transcription factor complex TTD-A subunit
MLTSTGVLVECDASIKAIIVKINAENGNAYIIEDIDDEHVLIQAAKHEELKARLNAVCALQEIYCSSH